MSPGAPLPTSQSCLERAIAIKTTANTLFNNEDDWHAVCYFYSAYHTVKAAFIEDPIFDNPPRLQLVNRHLIPDDRYVTHHKGRLGGNGPRKLGVNDIVQLIYPNIAVEYVRLHMASIEVRYESGLSQIGAESVKDDYAAIIQAYTSGALKA